MNKTKLNDEFGLTIQNQQFSNEVSLAKYIECDALPGIAFVNCSFEEVYLRGTVFGSCRFQNCTFNNFTARKSIISGCSFEDCKRTNSDMSRAEFYDTHFKNCEFLSVDLAASDFDSCKFEGTRLLKSNLNFIRVNDVKVWKSNEWVEIENFSSFQKYLGE